MTPEAKKRYDEKVARVEAAIALKEPDMVPMMPSAALFPMLNAGYTVAEVIYDTSLEKMTKSIVKYLNDFDPDAGLNTGTNYAGEGPMLELEQPKNMRWAGMPGHIIDDNSISSSLSSPPSWTMNSTSSSPTAPAGPCASSSSVNPPCWSPSPSSSWATGSAPG